VRRLKLEGFWVRGVDVKRPEFSETAADEFVVDDLRSPQLSRKVVSGVDEVYRGGHGRRRVHLYRRA
jgi:hypothetical protein